MSDRILLADIGGTNARFAVMEGDEISPPDHLRVADFPTVEDAISAYLSRQSGTKPNSGLLGVAGPVVHNRCIFTNSSWVVDGDALAKHFDMSGVRLLNDFEALGWSLPALKPTDLFSLGAQRPEQDSPMLVLGPGTGFGTAAYLHTPQPAVVVTEAGHAILPATSDREADVIAELRRRFGYVHVERVLSGSGIEHLYQAIAAVDGVTAPARDAAGITEAAFDGSCALCQTTIEMFCAFLGVVAGNLALTFLARGGVFIAGGIVPRFAKHLAATQFRTQFEGKSRYKDLLSQIPTSVITTPDTSFIGLKTFYERGMRAGG